jgi:hypothetical protein
MPTLRFCVRDWAPHNIAPQTAASFDAISSTPHRCACSYRPYGHRHSRGPSGFASAWRAQVIPGVKDLLGKSLEKRLALRQPLARLRCKGSAMEIELADLLKPARELLQILLVLLEFRKSQLAGR